MSRKALFQQNVTKKCGVCYICTCGLLYGDMCVWGCMVVEWMGGRAFVSAGFICRLALWYLDALQEVHAGALCVGN